jgi:exosortase
VSGGPRSLLRRLAAAAIAVAIVLGLVPLLHKFLVNLGEREQYAFYPLLSLAALLLALFRLRELPAASLRRGSWWVAGPLLLFALGLSAVGAVFYMRWFAAPAALVTLAAVVWRLGGPVVARTLLPVGVLLLVIIPPPFHLDEAFTQSLQRVAVQKSSALLDMLHVPHVRTGTVIEIPGHRLMIEEACSGINSLLSVIAFTLLFAFLKRRSAIVIVLLSRGGVVRHLRERGADNNGGVRSVKIWD